ncbi:hypothetical protein EPN52_03505 [bacterium]|nr:MAG: hypothetical protein EPN52_03505 [bacterium]
MSASTSLVNVPIGTAILLALASCSGSGGMSTGATPVVAPNAMVPAPMATAALRTAADPSTPEDNADDPVDGTSILKRLNHITTIGSTVDPSNGDQNPYGLAVASVDAGAIEPGDLVVCNFNNAANVQGTGTTIVALHPKPGSTPRRVAQKSALLGCTEVALAPNGNIWASAFAANDNPIVAPDGTLRTTLPGGPWHGPFGQTFAPHPGSFGSAAFYESNAGDGTIVRIGIGANSHFTFEVIASGFAVNHGAPGSILGPSGLQYDRRHDRLYIVDGADNTLVALRGVSTIPAGGVVVHGTSFSGPFAKRARLIFSGTPLNGPISSALLPDGHLVLGNTLDSSGFNLMVEIAPNGRLLDVKNVDTGAAGALFGMAATGHDNADTALYFNDDNDNTVKELTP